MSISTFSWPKIFKVSSSALICPEYLSKNAFALKTSSVFEDKVKNLNVNKSYRNKQCILILTLWQQQLRSFLLFAALVFSIEQLWWHLRTLNSFWRFLQLCCMKGDFKYSNSRWTFDKSVKKVENILNIIFTDRQSMMVRFYPWTCLAWLFWKYFEWS